MPEMSSRLSNPNAGTPVEGELLFDTDGGPQADHRLWLKLLSSWTDNVFEVPGLGWRFGLDPIIGLVPVVGDLASAAVSFYILSVAAQMQVPRSTLARMGLNVGIDYLVGSIPLFGNVFDFVWKANQKNMKLLERHIAAPQSARTQQGIWDWIVIGSIGLVLVAGFVGSLAGAILIAGWLARLIGIP